MDLSTTYLGMKLRTPLVPSASPLSEDVDKIKQMRGSMSQKNCPDPGVFERVQFTHPTFDFSNP